MEKKNSEHRGGSYDFAVIGSGFGGSITAMGLKQLGYSVCVIEKNSHPRFAIGESSTPIADMILRDLADDYDLPFLKQISRYGEWQKNYPDVRCGLKRGFSYFHHQKEKNFETDPFHKNELLVAASLDNENSDTNWFRSDVDHFLIQKAVDLGIDYFEKTEVIQLDSRADHNDWFIKTDTEKLIKNYKAKWIIDATGSADFSGKFFDTSNDVSDFKTNSVAIYSHFNEVPSWSTYLQEKKISTDDYPYNPDDSALHHIIDEGWIWMLRFNDGLLSCGMVLDEVKGQKKIDKIDHRVVWNQILNHYPSLHHILQSGVYANQPGRLIHSGRLQRKLNRTFGEGWIALNHTACFVDPMHSTGIAFTLSGIERLLKLFRKRIDFKNDHNALIKFQDKTFKELEYMDILISMTYRSRWNPELFTAAVMLYFVSTVQYEQRRIQGLDPDLFLSADDQKLRDLVFGLYPEIIKVEENKNVKKTGELVTEITKKIEPFNTVGLMDASKRNMYRHTAVNLHL